MEPSAPKEPEPKAPEPPKEPKAKKATVTYWRHSGSGFSRIESGERRNYGNGDVVEFGANGPTAGLRDVFEQVVNPKVEEGA